MTALRQHHARADRGAEAAARRGGGRGQGAARLGRARRPRRRLSGAAFRRPAPARRHLPGAGDEAALSAARRGDQRARSRDDGGSAGDPGQARRSRAPPWCSSPTRSSSPGRSPTASSFSKRAAAGRPADQGFLRSGRRAGAAARRAVPVQDARKTEAERMLLVANAEAWPGFQTTVDMLRSGSDSLDALVAGIGRVEADARVRSVGYGGWPNMLGEMECDAAVMDGNTREIGSVGAVPDTIHVAALAHEVMKRLPHVMLTGAGARRFATETGFAARRCAARRQQARLARAAGEGALAGRAGQVSRHPAGAAQPGDHRSRARARHDRLHLAPTPRAASTRPPRPPAGRGNIRAGSATARSPAPASMPTAATAPPPARIPAR